MIPQEKKCLSGSALKLIAVITMLIDHTAHTILIKLPFAMQTFAEIGSFKISIYIICRWIGRIAFPIYGFLLTEGLHYTHDRRKYAANLLLFALLSEIPWNLIHEGKLFLPGSQNVFFTLFLGLLCMMLYEFYQEDLKKQCISLLILSLIALLLHADYGFKGMGFLFILYLLKEKPIPLAIVSSSMLNSPAACMLAFIPIGFYNHERGFIRGKVGKYCFYAFYPIHMLILYFIKKAIWGYS